LGTNAEDNFFLDGESAFGAKSLSEFCYGYDGKYSQLQLLHVYETVGGVKFAVAEISNGVYGFWRVWR
jgi:hypothetical protein